MSVAWLDFRKAYDLVPHKVDQRRPEKLHGTTMGPTTDQSGNTGVQNFRSGLDRDRQR